jgi:hypothetical protein
MPKYNRIPLEVEAIQLSQDFGTAKKGEWLLTHANGKHEVMKDDDFKATYQSKEPEATKPHKPLDVLLPRVKPKLTKQTP